MHSAMVVLFGFVPVFKGSAEPCKARVARGAAATLHFSPASSPEALEAPRAALWDVQIALQAERKRTAGGDGWPADRLPRHVFAARSCGRHARLKSSSGGALHCDRLRRVEL